MSFLRELERRNVVRVAIAYLAGAWLMIEVAETILPRFGFSDAAVTNLIVLLAIGFLPVVILAWAFEWTPEGMKRDTGEVPGTGAPQNRWLDRIVMIALALAVGYFAVDKYLFEPARDVALHDRATQEGRATALLESYGDRSIAVLPFVNMSADPEQEYFSDGMAEEILNLLARIEDLRVISRSSAFSFKDKDISIPEVGKALDVAHVLEGSVRRSGNTIRITAQLIDARTDTHLWSETYDREFADIFAIQDEIAAAVTDQLSVTLLGSESVSERIDPQAYAQYLHARHLFNSFLPGNQAQAKALVEQVLAIEPDYVPALILKLRTVLLATVERASSPEFRELVDRIVAIDPDNERANSMLSWVALYVHGDVPSAANYLKRAMSRPSSDLEFLRGTSIVMTGLGLTAEAIAVQTYVVDRDPTCIQCRYLLAASYRDAGFIEKAEPLMQGVVDMQPGESAFVYALARVKLLTGKPEAVLEWVEDYEDATLQRDVLAIMARHDLGETVDARAALQELAARHDNEPGVLAEGFAWTGDTDRAFGYLGRLSAGHDFLMARRSPFLKNLHADPRWHALLAKHHIAPEQLDALDIRIRLPHGVRIVEET